MPKTIVEQIMAAHLVSGELAPGVEVALKIDHTLTQDATGTLAYLEFEAMGVDRARPEVAVSYVDHNLPQTDFRNADDHRFLRTVAAKYGLHFSPPGNGISHQVHLERFSAPGKTLLGSDSHTPTAGGAGMLAFGAGGLDVALALAGQPFYLVMPEVLGVRLTGRLRPWVSAKDVILELLRRLTVKGGRGKILEFFGPALRYLSVPQRAAITNMGAELGATTSIFPADAQTRRFLKMQGREEDFRPLTAQGRPRYAEVLEIDLDELEAPHRPAQFPGPGGAGGRAGGDAGGAGAHRLLRQLVVPGFDDRGPGLAGPAGASPGEPGDQSRLPAGAGKPDPGRGAGAAPGGRGPGDAAGLLGLHRHGPGPAHRCRERAHLSPELSGTQRHQGRPGLSGQPRNRGGRGHLRGTTRPPGPGGLSPGDRAPAAGGERGHGRPAAAAGRGRGGGPGSQHRALSATHAPARDLAWRSVAQSGG